MKTTQAMLLLAFLGATAAEIPTFTFQGTTTFPRKMGADIAASQFVDETGTYRFISSVASYAQYDDGTSYTRTFTGNNFGHLSDKWGTDETSMVDYNSYWDKPGSMCYRLDEREVNPMPSLYQDDHCDVIGVWIDPATKEWYGGVNDEYQFDPWNHGEVTQNARIKTGRHNNRLLLARSGDQGKTWAVVDQIVTDPYQPNQTITPELFPNATYSWGLSGVRFYPDYISGYAYLLYNHQFRTKNGDKTLLGYFSMARTEMASGLTGWKKWYGGKWEEPGVGGRDGFIGEPLGFNVVYDPKTDYLAFEGKGADGSDVVYQNEIFTAASGFKFRDLDGTEYHVSTASKPHSITRDGSQVDKVTYLDPVVNRTILATIGVTGEMVFNATDADGASIGWVPTKGLNIFKSPEWRVYVPPKPLNQAGFTYHVPSSQYLANGYELPISATHDLGDPSSWRPVGKQTEDMLAHASYLSVLDTGSLTNQFVTGRTLSLISDLRVTEDRYTAPADNAYLPDFYPPDAEGKPLTEATYNVSIGDKALGRFTLEWVKDTYNGAYTGFFRLKGEKGYLKTDGSVADTRKWGAPLVTGAKGPDFDPKGNGGHGSPYGSDVWFLIPFTGERTSLDDTQGYKLAHRASHNVATNGASGAELQSNQRATNEATKVSFALVK
ncbi:hypothetical protein A1Q2_05658 [Trichosporon asahii var. asahii CBS 8904]|uniref:Uncharacterized protein n=2 Tax=Trichosporon asahii var. asahii TaxID=189963 RepID=K1VGX3_TRIAC|nr:hypothetical protein A1Q1_03098 [Trichosporon asahii var. asahii CBS 2479]EJT52644.1 hypothetical protein A1Q1_03098 [Trichosporon asahii var. asahii CBS 2479]EKD00066.1 hypothetical protein A1Q2_05658 [Trichosporon asahii var. asahii CBS 8904]